MSVPLWESAGLLAREIATLTPALAGEDVSVLVSVDNPAIHFAAVRVGGCLTLIAVNTTDRLQSCAFRIDAERRGEATVRFENRTLPTAEGVVADAFGKRQRHVYGWE